METPVTTLASELELQSDSNLPEEVVVSILSRLPLKTLVRCRAVCKKWYSFFDSHAFLNLRRASATPEMPWFLFNRQDYGTGSWFVFNRRNESDIPVVFFNTPVTKWHKLNFKSLPSQIDRVLATAGGLMLCVGPPTRTLVDSKKLHKCTSFFEWPDVFVCNPLREKCWRKLPERPGTWFPKCTGMIVDEETKSYKILLASQLYGTEVYSSVDQTWKLSEQPQEQGATVFAIAYKACLLCVGAYSVCVYSFEHERWSYIELPINVRNIWHAQLESCGEHLVLVGYVRNVYGAGEFSLDDAEVVVWEFEGDIQGKGCWQKRCALPSREIKLPHAMSIESEEGIKFLAASGPADLVSFLVGDDANLSLYSYSQNKWCSAEEKTWRAIEQTDNYVNYIQRVFLRFLPSLEAYV